MGCLIRSFYLLFLLLGLWLTGTLAFNLFWLGPRATEWWLYLSGGFAILAILCIYYFFVNFVGEDEARPPPPPHISD